MSRARRRRCLLSAASARLVLLEAFRTSCLQTWRACCTRWREGRSWPAWSGNVGTSCVRGARAAPLDRGHGSSRAVPMAVLAQPGQGVSSKRSCSTRASGPVGAFGSSTRQTRGERVLAVAACLEHAAQVQHGGPSTPRSATAGSLRPSRLGRSCQSRSYAARLCASRG